MTDHYKPSRARRLAKEMPSPMLIDRRIGYVEAYKSDDLVISGGRFGPARRHAGCDRRLGATGRGEGRLCRQLYRLDCGHSLANDESVWTPGENVGRTIAFSSTCWLIQRGNEWLLWDTGVPQSTLNDPKGWSTLPKLIVYHLDKSITDQLAAIGLKTSNITYVALSHTHGDHIGNVNLFPNSTVLMQRAEYEWIGSPDGPNDNVNQLKALARKLLGAPKHLKLLEGNTDVFGDGSVTLVSTPGHTPGHQSLLVHLKNSGFIILSGDVVHLEENFQKNTVPSLNTDQTASIASMARIRQMMATYQAKLFINHDKAQSDTLKLLPGFYD